MSTKTWAQERAQQIKADLRRSHGAGFDKLSESQQNALVEAKAAAEADIAAQDDDTRGEYIGGDPC